MSTAVAIPATIPRLSAPEKGFPVAWSFEPSAVGVDAALESSKVVLVGGDLADVAQSLRDHGFDVASGRSAEDALALFDVSAPACVLLQIGDAPLACRPMRDALPLASALLAITADDDSRVAVECLSAGADEVVPRTTPPQLLVARVRAQLRRKQSEVELLRDRETRAQKALADQHAAHLVELERMNEELGAANKELETFSYSVSHDLRAPLRAIDGFSRVLVEDYADKLGDQGKADIARILGATKRMGELIEDLLQLSRVGRAELTRQPVDIGEIARSVGKDLAERQPQKVTLAVGEDLAAEGDPRLLRAVLENLLGNAWKFSAKHEDPRVEVGVAMRDGERAFFVKDNGVGFDMKLVDRLYRPFQRLHSSKEFEGTGIGLATVKRIIGRHGGKAWAESSVGGGACMYFTLG